MRVALDATPLILTSGGLRRYVEELSLALAREFSADTFTLISDQPFQLQANHVPANLVSDTSPKTAFDRKWWLAGAALATKRHNSHVFHGTNFEVPLLRLCPSVMTIHDLSPWKNPEWHATGNRVRRRTPLLLRLRRADAIITPTEAVRREVIDQFAVRPERVFAVPEAAGAQFRPTPSSPKTAQPYFLFTGTLEPRKNVGLLLTAWREVRKQCDVRLVIVGRTRNHHPAIPAEPGLELAGEVPDHSLAALYSQCAGFIYPSFYEGFGLPVLEAMQCGAPVVISRDPALQEVAGGAALTVDGVDELVAAMRALLTNRDRAEKQREKALQRAQEFSWQRTAQLTRQVYGEALGRFT